MWTYDNTYNELYHYGVPGMKWGVRKIRQIKEAFAARKAKKRSDAEAKLDAAIKKKTEDLQYKSRMYDKKQQLKGTKKDIRTMDNMFAKSNEKARAQLRAKLSPEDYARIMETFNQPAKKKESGLSKFSRGLIYNIGEGIKRGANDGMSKAVSNLLNASISKLAKDKWDIDMGGDKKRAKVKNPFNKDKNKNNNDSNNNHTNSSNGGSNKTSNSSNNSGGNTKGKDNTKGYSGKKTTNDSKREEEGDKVNSTNERTAGPGAPRTAYRPTNRDRKNFSDSIRSTFSSPVNKTINPNDSIEDILKKIQKRN